MRSFIWKVADGFDDLFGVSATEISATENRQYSEQVTSVEGWAIDLGASSSQNASSRASIHGGNQSYATSFFPSGKSQDIADANPSENSTGLIKELPKPYFQTEELVPPELDDEHLHLELEPDLEMSGLSSIESYSREDYASTEDHSFAKDYTPAEDYSFAEDLAPTEDYLY